MTVARANIALPRSRDTFVWAWGATLLLVWLSGCRTARDNQIDILERELRTQEDYIYELEDYVCQYSEKLRQCRCSQPTIVSETAPSKSVVKKSRPKPLEADDRMQLDDETELPAPSTPARRTPPPTIQPRPITPDDTSPEDFEAPDLEIGEPVGQMERDARVLRAVYSGDESAEQSQGISPLPPVIDTEPFAEDDSVALTAYDQEAYRETERVVVTHLFRGSKNEELPGSLLAVVEARDARDEPTDVDGEVSLMVMTADTEKPVRLKRWDFTAEDAASAWQSSHLGDGLHLELPLEETKLPNVPLELWVRVVAPDGSKLLTQVPFEKSTLVALNDEPKGVQEQLVDHETDSKVDKPEGRLLSAEEPVEDTRETQAGWKPSLVRSDSSPASSADASGKSGRWTAQPPGGRFPGSQTAIAEPQVKQPIWTAGRVGRVSSAPADRSAQPQWSPFR